jgi:hypothetical protein
MTHQMKYTTLFLSLAMLLTGLAPRAHAQNCSFATVAGNWSLTLTGTIITPTGPVPAAAVVNASLSPNGTASGTEGRSVGGEYANETFKGTYSVNSGCRGTATIQFFESGQLVRTSVLTILFDDNSSEIRMVQQSPDTPRRNSTAGGDNSRGKKTLAMEKAGLGEQFTVSCSPRGRWRSI